MGLVKQQMIEDEARAAERQASLPDRMDESLLKLGYITSRLEEVLAKFDPTDHTRVFLSHSSDDKPMVRQIMVGLREIGLNPWLDEDAMPSGTELHRAIQQGLKASCAAVFFVTPAFKDTGFLRKEIDYAVDEQRRRPEDFRIIPLVMGASNKSVPELLQPFVWKEAKNEIEALVEILRALPIRVGPGAWIRDV